MMLTVYHNGQYWIGILEEKEENQLKVAKYLFGAEPQDNEVLEFIVNESLPLLDSTHSVGIQSYTPKKVNPKRLARMVSKEIKKRGISSYAEEAIKKDLECKKKQHQVLTREQKELLKERKRELSVQKRKKKHRGR